MFGRGGCCCGTGMAYPTMGYPMMGGYGGRDSAAVGIIAIAILILIALGVIF